MKVRTGMQRNMAEVVESQDQDPNRLINPVKQVKANSNLLTTKTC